MRERRIVARTLDRAAAAPPGEILRAGPAAARLAGLAGISPAEYLRRAPAEQRAARLEIERELAQRRQFLRDASPLRPAPRAGPATAGASGVAESCTARFDRSPGPPVRPAPKMSARIAVPLALLAGLMTGLVAVAACVLLLVFAVARGAERIALGGNVALGGNAVGSGTAGAGVTPSAEAQTDIPPLYLALYMQAAARFGLDWTVLAGIGRVECDHGRDPAPSCTVEGQLNSAGAGGPAQFLVSTWQRYGITASGSGDARHVEPGRCNFQHGQLPSGQRRPRELSASRYTRTTTLGGMWPMCWRGRDATARRSSRRPRSDPGSSGSTAGDRFARHWPARTAAGVDRGDPGVSATFAPLRGLNLLTVHQIAASACDARPSQHS